MSKIALSGDPSGTGTFTIASPNSNSNYTLNLPTSSGTVVVTGGAQTIEFAAGTAAAPSITFTGDTNTGIFSPGADTIAFAEGGAEAMRITSAGAVGIGTTNPPRDLSIARGSGVEAYASFSGNGAANPFLVGMDGAGLPRLFTESQAISFWTTSTERMRIDSSGNVGIGTSSPNISGGASGSTVLTISATSSARNGLIELKGTRSNDTEVVSYIRTFNNSGATPITDIQSIRGANDTSGTLAFFTSNTESARIDSTGRMLIATTTISSGSNTAGLEVKAPNATNGQYGFAVINSAGSAYAIAYRNDGYFRSEPVYTQTSASAANVYVDSNGYMYRSTSSIKYKKDVIDYDKGLTAIQSLRPVYYKSNKTDANKNENNQQYAGFIAEEIDAAGLTEFVQYGEDSTPEGLAYGNMVAILTKAIQELKAINDAQATCIETLEAQNAAFEARLAALENK